VRQVGHLPRIITRCTVNKIWNFAFRSLCKERKLHTCSCPWQNYMRMAERSRRHWYSHADAL